MTPIYRVFRYEFLRHARKRGYLLFCFAVPILAVVLYFALTAASARGGSGSTDTGNNSTNGAPGATATPRLNSLIPGTAKYGLVDLSGLVEGANIAPFTRYPSREAAEDALRADKIGSFYLLPPDYLKKGEVELIMVRLNPNNDNETGLRVVLSRALAARLGQVDPAIVSLLTTKPPTIINRRITESVVESETAGFGTSFVLVYVFALAFVIGVFLSSGLLMQSVVEEKENRVVEILISSMRPGQLLAGKVLSLGLLGLIQIVCWGAAAVYILNRLAISLPNAGSLAVSPSALLIMFVYYLVGYVMFAAVYAGIGAISNTMREGPQFAAFFTLPAMIPLYLTASFATQPDSALAVFLSIFPITAPLAMVMRVSVSTVPAWQLALSLGVLIVTAVTFMWLAGRVFRMVIMLSGQPPKFRDIPRLLRENT